MLCQHPFPDFDDDKVAGFSLLKRSMGKTVAKVKSGFLKTIHLKTIKGKMGKCLSEEGKMECSKTRITGAAERIAILDTI